jgi:hypothetical protein
VWRRFGETHAVSLALETFVILRRPFGPSVLVASV